MKTYKNSLLLTLFTLFAIVACTPMDSTYKEFLSSSDISYPGKVDSITAHSGKERIRLRMKVSTDPSVVSGTVYWNGLSEKKEFTIDSNSKGKFIEIEVDDLEEYFEKYFFQVYTYNKEGIKSIPVEASCMVYGEKFRKGIVPRFITSKKLVGTKFTINWGRPSSRFFDVAVHLTYLATDGTKKTVEVSGDSNTTQLLDFAGTSFVYVTDVLPEENGIDRFSTDPHTVNL